MVGPTKQGKGAEAYRRLRGLIERGELDGSERLTEPRACRLTGMTRGPVREALLKLEGDGLLSSVGHSRTRVVQYLEDQSRDDLIARYQLRACIEAEAVRLAAENMSGAQARELGRLARRLVEALEGDDRHVAYEVKRQFFDYLIDNCGNSLIGQVWRTHRLQPPQPRSAAVEDKVYEHESEAQRRKWSSVAVAEAVYARDADRAERIVRERIAHFQGLLRSAEWDSITNAGE